MRVVGDTARAFTMTCSVEFIRSSPYMATLLTALKMVREAAHPNVGVVFDFYHFWSGFNRLEDMDQIRPGEIRHVHSPLVPMLRKLADKGYSGPLSVELFLPRFRDGEPSEVAREIRQKCEAIMRTAQVL
jgi:sugar phosphate isomerase/epimerase